MTLLGENPNCARTFVSFRPMGESLDVAEVTAQIGLAPDGIGERSSRRVWSISSEGRIQTTSVEQHLRLLLDMLGPHQAAVLALIEDRSLDADFFCFWESATGNGGPEVSPETLARIATLRATLGFDFYPPVTEG